MADLPALILALLGEATERQPCSIAYLLQRLDWYGEHASERTIKAAIKSLRDRGHIIVAKRGEPHGYYIDQTPEGARVAAWCLIQQGADMIATARRMVPESAYREMCGQARLGEGA